MPFSSPFGSSSEELSDIKPTIDALIHDTFVTSRPASHSTCASPPSTRATTPKMPTYMVRGQRPRPHVTLHRCQSVDGEAMVPAEDAATLARRLWASHDALLTDFAMAGRAGDQWEKTTLVVVDEFLRNDYKGGRLAPNLLVLTLEDWRGSAKAQLLEALGLRMLFSPSMRIGDLLEQLHNMGIKKLIVEGTPTHYHEIIGAGLYDKILVTTVPVFQGRPGTTSVPATQPVPPKLVNVQYEVLGNSIVMTAEPEFEASSPSSR